MFNPCPVPGTQLALNLWHAHVFNPLSCLFNPNSAPPRAFCRWDRPPGWNINASTAALCRRRHQVSHGAESLFNHAMILFKVSLTLFNAAS